MGVKGDLEDTDDSTDAQPLEEKTKVLGSQVWRVVPYAFRYPRRLLAGFLGNACARIVDLVPFVAICLLYTSPSPRDGLLSRMPSSA